MQGCGSSPRVRGKLALQLQCQGKGRIIPARAGQTRVRLQGSPATPDHPRACGANMVLRIVARLRYGSSPRVRGKHLVALDTVAGHRIIPARAGQTVTAASRLPSAPDHPRACGANSWKLSGSIGEDGSSPRVRGKLVALFAQSSSERIIPARAGQTTACSVVSCLEPDHPRACGANIERRMPLLLLDGSSPRVRGKRHRHNKRLQQPRIIPARAGQTSSVVAVTGDTPDHPRACGANRGQAFLTDGLCGSSPRVRGKRQPPRILP